jgi:hypothetical protein
MEFYLFTRLGVEQDPSKLDNLSRILCNIYAMFIACGSHMDDHIAVNVVRDCLRRRLLLRLLLRGGHAEAVSWVWDGCAECVWEGGIDCRSRWGGRRVEGVEAGRRRWKEERRGVSLRLPLRHSTHLFRED